MMTVQVWIISEVIGIVGSVWRFSSVLVNFNGPHLPSYQVEISCTGTVLVPGVVDNSPAHT